MIGIHSNHVSRARVLLMAAAVVCIAVAALSVSASPVAAQERYNESWEHGNLANYTDTGGATTEIVSTKAHHGNNSLRQWVDNQEADAELKWDNATEVRFDGDKIISYNVEWDLKGTDSKRSLTRVRLNDSSGEDLRFAVKAGTVLDFKWDMQGSLVERQTDGKASDFVENGEFQEVIWRHNESTGNVTVSIDGTKVIDTNLVGTFENPEDVTVEYRSAVSNSAGGDQTAEAWYDNITVHREPQPSEDLDLQLNAYMKHGTLQSYEVYENVSGGWKDVTDSANVTSDNSSVVQVHSSNNTLQSTSDETVNRQVNITATYNAMQDTEQVTVANSTVENIDILPVWWKINAVISDWAFLWIVAATLSGVVAARQSRVFAGVGAFCLVMIMGWVVGDVSRGLVIVSTFTGIFIALNVAANVDYSVRKG